MTTPFTPEQVDYWRKQVVDREDGIRPWPDHEVVALAARFLATLDRERREREAVVASVVEDMELLAEDAGTSLDERDVELIEAATRTLLARLPFFAALLDEHPESFVPALVDAARATPRPR